MIKKLNSLPKWKKNRLGNWLALKWNIGRKGKLLRKIMQTKFIYSKQDLVSLDAQDRLRIRNLMSISKH